MARITITNLIRRRHAITDDRVHLSPGQDLVVDQWLLLGVEQNGDGIALVDVLDHAGAKVFVSSR